MHAKMSPDNLYLRFFSFSHVAAEREARRIRREPGPDHDALLAVLDGEVVVCGSYEYAGDGSRSAEAALAVADDMHSRDVGTPPTQWITLAHVTLRVGSVLVAAAAGGPFPDGDAVAEGDLLGPMRTSLTSSRRTRCRSQMLAVAALPRS